MTKRDVLITGSLGACAIVVPVAVIANPLLGLVLLAAIALGVAAASEHAAWVLYFICATLTGVLIQLGPAQARPEIFGFIFLLVALRHARRRGTLPARRVGLIVTLLGLYVAVLFLSSATVAPRPIESLWIWTQIALSVALFVVVIRSGARVDVAVRSGTAVVGTIALITLAGWLMVTAGIAQPGTWGIAADGRMIGFSFENNIFAAQLVTWLSVLWARGAPFAIWERLLIVVIIIDVALAATRAAWLAGAFLLLFVVLKHVRSAWFGPLLVLCAGAFLLAPQLLGQLTTSAPRNSPLWRLGNLLNTEDGTGAYRVDIFATAIDESLAWPRMVIGSGVNSYSQYHLMDRTNRGPEYLPNVFLATLYDGGFIAISALLFAFAAIAWNAKSRSAVLCTTAVVLICSTTTNVIWFQFAWIAIAVAFNARKGTTLAGQPEIRARSNGRRAPLGSAKSQGSRRQLREG